MQASALSLNTTIADLRAEIADLAVQKERAKEDRAAEKLSFDSTVADQRQAIDLLTKAVDVLKAVYRQQQQSSGALLQQRQHAQLAPAPAPPASSAQPTP